MTVSRGGLYNKLGLYYETELTIKQILRIHSGQFDSIYLEHPEVGDKFEFMLKSSDKTEYHQVKRQKSTFKDLEPYIKEFHNIYKRDKRARFIFVSTISATKFQTLRDKINISDSFDSFNQELIQYKESNEIKQLFDKIKKSLNISDEELYSFGKNLEFFSEDERLMNESNCSYINANFKEDVEKVRISY